MVRKYLTIISGLVFTATTGIVCPMNTKAIEDIEPVEVVSMRSEYEKHYDNGDGTYTAYIDTVPLHYYENGEWLDIDNTLIQDENGNYINKSNSMKVTLSPETSINSVSALSEEPNDNNQMVSVDYNGYSLSWSLIDTISENEPVVMSEDIKETENTISSEESYPVASLSINEQDYIEKEIGMNKLNSKISESVNNLDSSVSYNDIYEDLDCKVDIQPNSVKETLILENPDNLLETYNYFIQSDGLVAELCEDNSVVFSNGEKNVFTIPAPFMFDSSEDAENNYNISVTLEECNDGYIYTLSPDMDWLADESRIYPVMIDPYVIPDNTASITCRYNSQANSNHIYSGIKVGGESNNAYETYINLENDYFEKYPSNICITEASFYVRMKATSSVFTDNFDLYALNANVPYIFYNDTNKGKASCCKYVKSLSKTSSTSDFGWSIDITELANAWFNYSHCGNMSKGIPQYGFKLVAESGSKTLQGYDINDSLKSNRPYFWFNYEYSDDYYLPYSPERYNDIYENSNVSIENFQSKMNCYAYALQTYYSGSDGYYELYPGEIGIGNHVNDGYDAQNFGELQDYYLIHFENKIRNVIKKILENKDNIYASQIQSYVGNNETFRTTMDEYMVFIENQMKRDATTMNFNISKYLNKNIIDYKNSNKFILPDNFDEDTERIIAMVAYYNYKNLYDGSLSMHYYMRNGSGTCPIHEGNCSIWSNKMGSGIVKNYPETDTSKILCDETIYNYAYDLGNRFNGYNKDLVYFFNITKDTNIYGSRFENGHNRNSTGTSYYH